MTHKTRHNRHSKSLNRKFKRMAAAAAVAGAAFVSSALLPGMPATAHASAVPDAPAQPDAAVQQMVKTPKGSFGLQSDSKIPQKKLARIQARAAAERSQKTINPLAANSKAAPAKEATQAKRVEATPVSEKTPASEKTSAQAPEDFQKVVEVKATAYAPGAHDNEQWGDKTFLGTTVRPGVVAVDPDVIPLGSRLYIEYPDGTGHYATAEDTGGAIKGNRIDVAQSSVDQAYDFGVKNAKVYVLGPGTNA
ncbi:3D domain-containing protein [Sporomusa acidovorans]|uniref:3D domain-containing protein n=1 Tax=Sporomusa acidovorans (strain ATCC 49682 / DSM 3132 / Mol) TaxID=1123286 RepID=A0ABZ3J8X4_SPOA4|nr:3D domain-containing protein [Sporomusa acidovorans]OZC17527.1 cell wall-binding protein YocH precursor [Sporomusa acidovorans DSM 3132]SDF08497.1 3D (Asp-Asp-Asp) domain-containing protein [Sporomusa acidovorans]